MRKILNIRRLGQFIPVLLLGLIAIAGCSKADPYAGEGVTLPTGPRDPNNRDEEEGDSNENDSGEEKEKDPEIEVTDSAESSDTTSTDYDPGYPEGSDAIPHDFTIIGKWQNAGGTVWFEFTDEKNFRAYGGKQMGFKVDQPSEIWGSYTYSDMKTHLWLTIQGEEIYFLEFDCKIKENELTLTAKNGKQTILQKVD